METDVGFVCGRCDTFAPFDTGACAVCSAELGFPRKSAGAAPVAAPAAVAAVAEPLVPPAAQPPAAVVGPVVVPAGFVLTEALMEQARSYVCKKCYTPVPPGHK